MVGFVLEDRGYATPCRIWQGALRGSGPYGTRRRGSRLVYVHRDEWEKAHGPIPAGMRVLHRCDVPACAELSHLFLGTQADNVADMDAKGRRGLTGAPGERNGRAKLTLEQVRAIRGSSERAVVLVVRFGVSRSTVHKIRQGARWRDAA